MRPSSGPPRHRPGSLIRGLVGFSILVLLAAGAWVLQRRSQADAKPPAATAAAADSVGARADSLADSTAVVPKRGFFSFGRRSRDKDKTAPDPVPVELVSVRRDDVPSYFSGTATVEAEQQAEILAKTSGTILQIFVEEGDEVREGQVLLEVDCREQAARHEEMRVKAQSQEREFERRSALHEKGLSSDREFEDQKLLLETARAQLHVGEIGLGYCRVRAPFSGRITRRLVNVGQNVGVATPLFVVADFDPLLARVYMPEKQVERVRLGQSVRIVPDARPRDVYEGRVSLIAPVVDTRSGTVKVTVELLGSPADLRPGAFVRAEITTDIHPRALVIPKQALVAEGGETYVFRAAADSVAKVRIETGFTDEKRVEVVIGLTDGDRVVAVGQGGLKHGSRIRELPPAGADSSDAVVRR